MIYQDNIIAAYGEEIVCDYDSFKGFISPIEPKNAENKHIPLPAGIANEAEYLLITNFELAEKATVCAHGENYEVRRVEPIYFAGEVSHYECVLRPKGSADDV